MPARIRKEDPIRKILETNKKVGISNITLNTNLNKIIHRVITLDRPILMHDKLDVIWEKEPTMKKDDTK